MKAINLTGLIKLDGEMDRIASERTRAEKHGDTKKAEKLSAQWSEKWAEFLEKAQPLNDAIIAAEGKARIRTITADDVVKAVKLFPACVKVKNRVGCRTLSVDPNAQAFAKSYNGRPESTKFDLVSRPSGWFVERIRRDTCTPSRGRITFTEGAMFDIIKDAETVK